MRRLVIFRHGKAETVGPEGGDRERPLARKGWAQSAETAAWLAQSGFSPNLVFVSPSLRTRQTWEGAAGRFPAARATFPEALYLADINTLINTVTEVGEDADTVMLVGHNPGLEELCQAFAEQAGIDRKLAKRLAEGLPTGAAVVFQIKAGRATSLEGAFHPAGRDDADPRWSHLAAQGAAET